MYEALDSSIVFEKAAEEWINSRTMTPGSRARYISPRTLLDLQQYIRALNRKFGPVPLREVHVGMLREYQRERAETCGANKINQELGTLLRIMKRARAWSPDLEECYEPLQREEPDIPRAMTPEEQKRFLDVASSRDEWQFVYFYSLLALATSASSVRSWSRLPAPAPMAWARTSWGPRRWLDTAASFSSSRTAEPSTRYQSA